jgi:hypothetical protein
MTSPGKGLKSHDGVDRFDGLDCEVRIEQPALNYASTVETTSLLL